MKKPAGTEPVAPSAAAEVRRQEKVIQALMHRVERSMGLQGGDFGLFQTALTLENTVHQRTRELESALRENEKVNRDLYRLTGQLWAEIQERKQAQGLRAGQYEILEMIASDSPLRMVLRKLAGWVEQQSDSGVVSVLLLDEAGTSIGDSLSVSLPDAYCKALVGLEIGPSVGSCGTAMFNKETVLVRDIERDPLWQDYRHLALGHGFRACWSTPILAIDGGVLGSFAIYYRDVAEPSSQDEDIVRGAVHLAGIAIRRSRDEARIRYLAQHDSLTGLPNRILFHDRVSVAIEQAQREGRGLAVLMVDLDQFKHVNDSLGHHVGDRLLEQVSDRLAACVRGSDSVARLGGDEFVLCLAALKHRDDATFVARKVLSELGKPFFVSERRFHLGASIGISVYPENGEDVHELLRAADTAMYAVKDSGRGDFRYFTEQLNAAAHERMTLLSQLQQAIRENEFTLHYQPQFRLSDGRLVGAEALLRWQHPERGLLAPGEFLSVLEEHGLIVEVGSWVLQAVCAQNAEWQSAGLPPISASVNVAAEQFHRSDLVTQVRRALEQSGLEARWLMLEFTESVLLRDSESTLAAMEELRKMGVELSLDDFGTGYSSLSYLHRFPVNQLKIDRSFVQNAATQSGSRSIVASIVQLASSLGLHTVAEGLELKEQVDFMQSLNCTEGQGFLLGRPMPAAELQKLLAACPT